jgi:hypothetical protein
MAVSTGFLVFGAVVVIIVDLTVWCCGFLEVAFGTCLSVVTDLAKVLLKDADTCIDSLELLRATDVLISIVAGLVGALLLLGLTSGNCVVVGLAGLVLILLSLWDVFLKLGLV